MGDVAVRERRQFVGSVVLARAEPKGNGRVGPDGVRGESLGPWLKDCALGPHHSNRDHRPPNLRFVVTGAICHIWDYRQWRDAVGQ